MTQITLLIRSIILYLNCYCVYGKSYSRHALCRAIPNTQEELNILKDLPKRHDINYWRFPGRIKQPIEFTVGPESKINLLLEAKESGLNFTVIFNDVQSLFDKQSILSYHRSNLNSFNWDDYFKLQDIYAWMLDLNRTHPNEVYVESIGNTEEKREIMSLKLALPNPKLRKRVILRSTAPSEGDKVLVVHIATNQWGIIFGTAIVNNPPFGAVGSIVIIEGGIHAREWISPAFVTHMIFTLLHAPHSKDDQLKLVASSYVWYFIPVFNPDGYEYSHTKDRLWRKNRNNYGVDLNRNFAFHFGKVDCSSNPDVQNFCGLYPFSERETSAIAKLISSHCKEIEYYIAFHSYGQCMIIPYTHSNEHLENYDEVKQMGDELALHISKRYGTTYSIGTAIETVGYATSGASMCWAKNTCKIPYAAAFDLRDSGYYGFALPPELIKPTCLETMDGLLSFLTPRSVKILRKGKEIPETSAQTRIYLDKCILICKIVFFVIINSFL